MGIGSGNDLLDVTVNLVVERILEIPEQSNRCEAAQKQSVLEEKPAGVDQTGENGANPFARSGCFKACCFKAQQQTCLLGGAGRSWYFFPARPVFPTDERGNSTQGAKARSRSSYPGCCAARVGGTDGSKRVAMRNRGEVSIGKSQKGPKSRL